MKLLFVCTGNIFRSMSAEYLAKKYIKDNKIKWIQISSAWTSANPEYPFDYTLERLKQYWCNASKHKQTKVSQDVLQDKDWVICMAKHHQEVIKSFGYEWVLFNLVAYDHNKDVMDEAEYAIKYWSFGDLSKYVNKIVDYIHNAIPKLIEWLNKFEIEKKFLIKKLPNDINKYPKKEIIQWYFKDKNNKTVRIRKISMKGKTEYFQTIKKWHWLIKKEQEEKINKETFDKLWKKVSNQYLQKTRYYIPYQNKTIELDIFDWKLDWTILAEVEFSSYLQSKKFIVPDWFGPEISNNKKFSNANLAKK